MSFFSIGAFCLIAASASQATTVDVGHPAFCGTSQHPIILTTQASQAVEGARVDIYRRLESGEKLVWTGSTDQRGLAKPGELAPASYRILAYSGTLFAEMQLGVSSKSEAAATCEVTFVPPISAEQKKIIAQQEQKDRLAALVKNAPSIQLKEFCGLAQDQGNAVIQRLKIEVLRKGALNEGDIAETVSNDRGQFALPLERGAYVAIFTYQGFQTRAIVFELGNEGWRGVKIAMSVGASPASPNDPPQEWNPER